MLLERAGGSLSLGSRCWALSAHNQHTPSTPSRFEFHLILLRSAEQHSTKWRVRAKYAVCFIMPSGTQRERRGPIVVQVTDNDTIPQTNCVPFRGALLSCRFPGVAIGCMSSQLSEPSRLLVDCGRGDV